MSDLHFGARNLPGPPGKTPGLGDTAPRATPDRAVAACATQDYCPAQLASRCILVVEDNDDALKALVFRLNRLMLAVATAHDGQEACDLALAALDRGKPFDWILMDMEMPVVDGFEATRRLRGQGYDRHLHVHQDPDHITKPIDWSRLAAILAAQLT
jgi:DNA-binding NtrC family response regulator